jgi:hypothetical protein
MLLSRFKGDSSYDDENSSVASRVGRDQYIQALQWWYNEYRCAAICVVGAILLGLLLHQYDGHLVPVLPLGIQLEVIIVAMMTAVRVALKSCVESSISQGAWIWVSGARQQRCRTKARLEDFKKFDEASRGL